LRRTVEGEPSKEDEMTDTQYVLWFILMAVGIVLILGLGTLTMAGVLHRPHRHHEAEADVVRSDEREPEHHHWYDRFHHAA
jgi:hypothetical protein